MNLLSLNLNLNIVHDTTSVVCVKLSLFELDIQDSEDGQMEGW